jgi:hypothetical protein
MNCCIIVAFFVEFAFADKCELGQTWLQGQQGSIELTIPADTIKWTIEMSFDKPLNHINVNKGRDETCEKQENVCTFNSESYNEKNMAGDLLELPYQIQFDEDAEAPQVTSVVFKHCDAEPCEQELMKEYIVTEECNEAPTDDPTDTKAKEKTETPYHENEEEEIEEDGDEDGEEECGLIESHSWNTGASGQFRITVPENIENWRVTLEFSGPVNNLNAHQGVDEVCDGEICTFTNESWNGVLKSGNVLGITYLATFDETTAPPKIKSVDFNGHEACSKE